MREIGRGSNILIDLHMRSFGKPGWWKPKQRRKVQSSKMSEYLNNAYHAIRYGVTRVARYLRHEAVEDLRRLRQLLETIQSKCSL